MELLLLLVERNGGLVSRQELAERLWSNPDSEVVKQSINNAVNRLRYALQDDAEKPIYIQTVIGKGYRFVSAVDIVETGAETSPQDVLIDAAPGDGAGSATVTMLPGAEAEAGVRIDDSELSVPAADQFRASVTTSTAGVLKKPPMTAGAKATRRNSILIAVGTVLIFVSGVFGISNYRKFEVVNDRGHQAYELSRLTSNPTDQWVTATAISPDGKTVAFAEPGQLRFESVSGTEINRIGTPDLRVIDRIAWFVDNHQLLVSGVNRTSGIPEVWLYSSGGDVPVKMRSDARMAVPSPSGSQIAFTNAGASEVWVMDTVGQLPRRLLDSSPGTTYEALTWNTRGHTLLAERLQRDSRFAAPSWDPMHGVKATYVAIDVSSARVGIAIDDVWMEDAALLPTGDLLYTQPDEKGLSLWSVTVDPETGGFRSSPHLLQAVPQLRSLTAASNGIVAAISIEIRPQIAVGDLRQDPVRLESVRPIATAGFRAYPHAWSPDSSTLYFEQQVDERWRIFSTSLASPKSLALVSSPLDQTMPRLTPDRRWILFAGREPGMRPSQLFRVPPAGGAPQLVHTNGPVSDFRCPSNAGKCLLRELDDLKRLVFVPIDPIVGVGPVALVLPWEPSNNLGDWNISADGQRLVLAPAHKSDPALQIVDIATGHTQQVSVDVHRPIEAVSWSADGKGWYLALANGHGSDLVYVEPQLPPVLLRQTTGRTFAVPSPDGRRLAFVDQNIDSNVWLLRPSGSGAIPNGEGHHGLSLPSSSADRTNLDTSHGRARCMANFQFPRRSSA